jgi:hypothetical protein
MRVVCIEVGVDPGTLSLSLLFAHKPALRDMHEAPHSVVVLKKSTDVRRFSPAAPREQPHRAVVLGLGLRRRPLALSLVNAQRYERNDAR